MAGFKNTNNIGASFSINDCELLVQLSGPRSDEFNEIWSDVVDALSEIKRLHEMPDLDALNKAQD